MRAKTTFAYFSRKVRRITTPQVKQEEINQTKPIKAKY
ncbi:hypothetical protein MNB_SV-3-250 [hydrothermal vent metagenome]|uniref:Uncharacterized protein n=1 Tax=hydrothermal vent metagenome TaxID=652676 RepID=A0A1W1CSQ7_9ZZZZ